MDVNDRANRTVPGVRELGPAFAILAAWIAICIYGFVRGLVTSSPLLLVLSAVCLVGTLYLLIGAARRLKRIRGEIRQ